MCYVLDRELVVEDLLHGELRRPLSSPILNTLTQQMHYCFIIIFDLITL